MAASVLSQSNMVWAGGAVSHGWPPYERPARRVAPVATSVQSRRRRSPGPLGTTLMSPAATATADAGASTTTAAGGGGGGAGGGAGGEGGGRCVCVAFVSSAFRAESWLATASSSAFFSAVHVAVPALTHSACSSLALPRFAAAVSSATFAAARAVSCADGAVAALRVVAPRVESGVSEIDAPPSPSDPVDMSDGAGNPLALEPLVTRGGSGVSAPPSPLDPAGMSDAADNSLLLEPLATPGSSVTGAPPSPSDP